MRQVSGHKAEQIALKWLESHGFRVIETNWKNRFAEIDIVSRRKHDLHIFEVKYRQNSLEGDGFDYITQAKIQRLIRATNMYIVDNQPKISQVHLGAIQVGGIDYQDIQVIEDIIID